MIIECANCSKKYQVEDHTIPAEGIEVECNHCNHVWFFKHDNFKQIKDAYSIKVPSNVESLILEAEENKN